MNWALVEGEFLVFLDNSRIANDEGDANFRVSVWIEVSRHKNKVSKETFTQEDKPQRISQGKNIFLSFELSYNL